MTTDPRPPLHLVVGYNGSPPAKRALDAALRLLLGRVGDISVVYVAHIPRLSELSPAGAAELETSFDEAEQELRAQATEQLHTSGADWDFHRRQGAVADELIAAATAISETHSGDTVAIAVGSSSHGIRRMVGSVAVHLARHSPVPLVIVP